MTNKNLCRLMTLTVLCCVSARVLFAQTAQINGRVIDSSGAVVPAAEITVNNVGTGIKRNFTSNNEGYYAAPLLQPGIYNMAVQKPGFKTIARTGIDLVLDQVARIDFQLEPGEVTETMNVEEPVVAVNSTLAEVATNVEEKAVKDLPLQLRTGLGPGRRQIDAFKTLTPGVTQDTFSTRINGGLQLSEEVLFDSVPIFSLGGWTTPYNPPYEAIDEFKVLSSVFSAQYGQGQGITSYHVASGTNKLHGTVHEFVRNDSFDARGFFPAKTAINKQNEYGFAIGGPVYIPKLYDGRNRTFFRFTWSQYRFRGASQTQLYTVPTEPFRRGDFSDLKDATGNIIPIFDPLTRTPFPGNRIPESRFSAVSKRLLPLIPAPKFPGLINNTTGIASAPVDDDGFSYKIDHNLSQNRKISFIHWRADQLSFSVCCGGNRLEGPLGGVITQPTLFNFMQLSYTDTFSHSLIMTFGVNTVWGSNLQINENFNTSVDFPGLPKGPNVPFPNIGFGGPVASPAVIGTGFSHDLNGERGTIVSNNWLWVKGRHAFNIGGDFRREANNAGVCSFGCPANFSFSNRTTSLPGSPGFPNFGHPFASFLLGTADSAFSSLGQPTRGFRGSRIAGYVQDDLRATPKLTLNLGLRYDVFIPFKEVANRIAYFDIRRPNPDAGGRLGALNFPGSCSVCAGRDRIADIYWKNLAPRLGFAYALDKKTVIRGGYGIIYFPGGASIFDFAHVKDGFANGLSASANYISGDNGVTPGYGSWDRPFPTLVLNPFGPSAGNGQNVNYMDAYHGRSGFHQNWDIGFQREMPGNILLSADYVGNKGTHLVANMENLNQVDPKYLSLGSTLLTNINSPEARAAGIGLPYPGFTGSVAQSLRPYPQYTGISNNFESDGSSIYHAFQLTAQRRFSEGLLFLASYTASRSYSNGDWRTQIFQAGAVNTFNRRAEWAISPADTPHSLVISGQYELPIGPGKSILSKKGAAGKVLGGWQFGWVARYRSGTPIGVFASNILPIFGGGNRPNIVPGADPQLSRKNFDPALDKVIDAAAFSQPADYTFGNAPRYLGNLRTFPFYNEDFNVSKRFLFTESINLEFRVEFFNVFNRVVFGGINSFYSPANPNLGRVSNQFNLPRQGQFALKLNF